MKPGRKTPIGNFYKFTMEHKYASIKCIQFLRIYLFKGGIKLEWFFDGLGTFLVGLLLGGTGGSAATWQVVNKRKSRSQRQRAGDNSHQIQSGRDTQGAQ